ncbi:MAG: hypothetical protein G8237_15465 [Magnetococcales bacterium]|nr:hypothetical protein [Magnetococcales bacterium]
MHKFKHRDRLIISTLSPIHVGSGMDYEPTHYVMDDGVMYTFDPVAALSGDRDGRDQLLAIVEQESGVVQKVQKFFYERRDLLIPDHQRRLPVGNGVQDFYVKRIGQTMPGNDGNRLFIERMTHGGVDDRPYLPGSSLKGSIRTALLDAVHGNQPLSAPKDAENFRNSWKRLGPLPQSLQGHLPTRFEQDPMRLLQIGDAMPGAGREVCEILFAVNRKPSGVAGRGPYQILESVGPLELEVMVSDWSFQDLEQVKNERDKIPARSWKPSEVMERCNRYFGQILLRELDGLAAALDPDWLQGMQQSMAGGNLYRLLHSGHAFLLRVGRHSGAESVTLNGVRHIKILQGKDKKPVWGSKATTVWLASPSSDQMNRLLPFGWLLIEVDHPGRRPLSESVPELVQMAERFRSDRNRPMQASDQKLLELRTQRQARQEKEEQRRAAEQARLEKQAADEARLVALSPNQRRIEELRQMIEKSSPQSFANKLWNETKKLVDDARSSAWSHEEKNKLIELCERELWKKINKGLDEKKKKALLDPLRETLS